MQESYCVRFKNFIATLCEYSALHHQLTRFQIGVKSDPNLLSLSVCEKSIMLPVCYFPLTLKLLNKLTICHVRSLFIKISLFITDKLSLYHISFEIAKNFGTLAENEAPSERVDWKKSEISSRGCGTDFCAKVFNFCKIDGWDLFIRNRFELFSHRLYTNISDRAFSRLPLKHSRLPIPLKLFALSLIFSPARFQALSSLPRLRFYFYLWFSCSWPVRRFAVSLFAPPAPVVSDFCKTR